jgi:hypothetical protein
VKALIVTLAVLGGLLGLVPPTVLMAPKLVDRLSWSLSGGKGERADWGETAFMWALVAGPLTLGGAGTGAMIGVLVDEFRKRRAARHATRTER